VAAELSSEVVVLVAEPEAASVAAAHWVVSAVAEPEAVFVVGPQVFVDIAVAFVVLVPVFVVGGEVCSSGRSRFLSFPNVDYSAKSSSSAEAVDEVSVHNPTGARTNYGLCSILSNLGLYQNKNLEHCYNNPSLGYNNASDTSDLPMDATTNHSRNRGLHQYQEQRRHTYQVLLLTLEVRQIR
jgi:hypothetical protein